MCTSLKYKNCMGRNFDYEISYKETIRQYNKEQYNIVGIATDIIEEYPLYYDAMNEHGLCMAGLNFEGNAYYYNDDNGIPPWELMVKILGNCKDVCEAKEYLKNIRIIDKQYNDEMPNSSLHWFICDKDSSITVEQTKKEGLQVYDNKNDVLTNNPPLPKQEKFAKVSKYNKLLRKILEKVLPSEYSTRGLDTYGVPGDLTSMGRYQRAVYYKDKLLNTNNNFHNVAQTFHLLDSVSQIYGATPINGKFEYTIYEVVYDMENLKIYVKIYDTFKAIPCIIKTKEVYK